MHCIDDKQIAPLRTLLVQRVRQEIADGSYPSTAAIDGAVDRVLGELASPGAADEAAAWDESNEQDRFDGGRLS